MDGSQEGRHEAREEPEGLEDGGEGGEEDEEGEEEGDLAHVGCLVYGGTISTTGCKLLTDSVRAGKGGLIK